MNTITLSEACRKHEVELAYHPYTGTAFFKRLCMAVYADRQVPLAYKVQSYMREGTKIYRTTERFNNIVDAVLYYNEVVVYK